MAHLKRTTRLMMLTALAALAVGALLASSAAASVVSAKFSTSLFKLTTSGLTVKRNGAEAKTCTPVGGSLEGYAEGSHYLAGNELGGEASFSCSGGTGLGMVFYGEAFYDTVANRYFLRLSRGSGSSLRDPWGQHLQEPGTTGGTWANGSGSTPSTLTYSNETLGWTTDGKKLTIEGSFTVTTPAGGLVTLSH